MSDWWSRWKAEQVAAEARQWEAAWGAAGRGSRCREIERPREFDVLPHAPIDSPNLTSYATKEDN